MTAREAAEVISIQYPDVERGVFQSSSFGDHAFYAFAPHDSTDDMRIVKIAVVSFGAEILDTEVPTFGKSVLKFGHDGSMDAADVVRAVLAAWATGRCLLGLRGKLTTIALCDCGHDPCQCEHPRDYPQAADASQADDDANPFDDADPLGLGDL
jgi:hypothetical protein